MSWIKGLFRKKVKADQCDTCDLCTGLDKMYSFRVSDYTTEIVGRKNEKENFFYTQRGDGVVCKYESHRVTESNRLIYAL